MERNQIACKLAIIFSRSNVQQRVHQWCMMEKLMVIWEEWAVNSKYIYDKLN